MQSKYFRSKDESSLEARFNEQQTSITTVTNNCQQKANVLRDNLTLYVGAPIQQTGTVSVSGATVTGVGTAFQTWFPEGGYLGITYNDGTEEEPDWVTVWVFVDSVTSDTELTLSSSGFDGYTGIPSLPGGGSDSNSGTSQDAPLATWAAVAARLAAIDICLAREIGVIVNSPVPDEFASLTVPVGADVSVDGEILPNLRVILRGGRVFIECSMSCGLSVYGSGFAEIDANIVVNSISAFAGSLVVVNAGTMSSASARTGGVIHLMSNPGSAVVESDGGVVMYPGVYGLAP